MDYEGTRRVSYDFGDEFGVAVFVPVCPQCGRFVKAGTAGFGPAPKRPDILVPQPNATCKKHGRVTMPFEGWFGSDELGWQKSTLGKPSE